MSLQALRHGAARRSLCRSCVHSRRTQVYYSQAALSFSAAGRPQDAEASTSAEPGGKTRSRNESDQVPSTRNPLEPTRVDRYLASIRAAGIEPTLEDVERCRPATFSHPESSHYAEEYNNLLDALCRSFSKDQLRQFTMLYKLDPIWTRSSRRKIEYAESIIEKAWGWPSLKEIERRRRDRTEVLVKAFPVTPSQLFLILGKDGANLLQLSLQYNAHISLMPNPLALRVEGLRGALKGLTEYISSLKKDIIDKIFELPTGLPVRPDLVQRISRLADAYVENHGNKGKVRICARDTNNITAAERLVLRASLEAGTQERAVCYNPPDVTSGSPVELAEPRRYAVYPFITPTPFPWLMQPGGTFRVRRVADWLNANSYEDTASTGGLADNQHRLLNFDETEAELRQLVFTAGSPEYNRRHITASLGNILLSSGDNSQRVTIFPPLRGVWSLSDILKWVRNSKASMTFVPSVLPSMMMATQGKRRVLHRLIYKTLPHIAGEGSKLPQRVLKFEMEFSSPLSTRARLADGLDDTEEPEDILAFNEPISGTEAVTVEESVSQPNSSNGGELGDVLDPRCQVGKETFLNVMMPDRSMDLQLSIFDHGDVAVMQQPLGLREYAEKLGDFASAVDRTELLQPEPPMTLKHEGREFYLHENLSLRHGTDPIVISTISSEGNVDDVVEVCSESILDLESSQRMELCQVKFDGASEESRWKHFLAACDQLSTMKLEQRSRKDEAIDLEGL